VPAAGAGAAPADLLRPGILAAMGRGLQPRVVDLALPRWDFGTDLDLVPALRSLGMSAPFGNADFSGIAPGLFIGQAVHRANITVDENGTEAAAVTGLAFESSGIAGEPITVRADHPFAFEIVHTPTQTPLFLGTVGDPTVH
jgi:serine protease inhibitor